MEKYYINYRVNGSNTVDSIWKASDSSYQTNIFNQLEIVDFIADASVDNVLVDIVVDNAYEPSGHQLSDPLNPQGSDTVRRADNQ